MDRSTVVSGGGTGIGRAVAHSFVLGGDRVLIIGRRADVLSGAAADMNEESGTDLAAWVVADLTVPEQVEPIAERVGGVVDVVVNAAGGVDRAEAATLAEVRDGWLRDVASSVLTAVLLTTALEPSLRRPGGRIVTISSIAAIRGGGESYSAAKAALIGWTFQLASALGPEGVTANVVAPGFIEGTEFFGGTMTDERRDRLIAETKVQRAGRPEDVAAAVRYLASPEAGFVTGHVLHVNGGAVFGR
jgi:3-oxoacyl-[acyl-carrier protein] reductase